MRPCWVAHGRRQDMLVLYLLLPVLLLLGSLGLGICYAHVAVLIPARRLCDCFYDLMFRVAGITHCACSVVFCHILLYTLVPARPPARPTVLLPGRPPPARARPHTRIYARALAYTRAHAHVHTLTRTSLSLEVDGTGSVRKHG